METTTITATVPADLASRLEVILVRLERQLAQPLQEWFSIKQAGVLTGLSPNHVRRAVVGGTLPCSNVGTRDRPTYRISRRDIEAWLDKRKAGALPPPRRSRHKKPVQELPPSVHFPPKKQRLASAEPPV